MDTDQKLKSCKVTIPVVAESVNLPVVQHPAHQSGWRRPLLVALAIVALVGAGTTIYSKSKPQEARQPKTAQETAMNDEKKTGESIGLDVSAQSSGTPTTGVEINNTGGGTGAQVHVTGQPGTSAIGVRSVVNGPGATGLRVIQNGPGVGLSVTVVGK